MGSVDIAEIYSLLYSLGITANYRGFFHTSYAVYLVIQDPERLLLITKWLYPEVAKHYKTTWQCVERNIRTITELIWLHNRILLEQMAHHPMEKKPRNGAFLSLLASTLTLPRHGLCQAVALSREDDDVRMVYQTVNESCRQAVVAEDCIPLREFQIRGNDEAFPLITIGNHLRP